MDENSIEIMSSWLACYKNIISTYSFTGKQPRVKNKKRFS